jgi:hypothetical protein
LVLAQFFERRQTEPISASPYEVSTRPKKTGGDSGTPAELACMMDNNTRQVFHTQGFENPQRHAVLTAAINKKAESASHLPRFFSVSMTRVQCMPQREKPDYRPAFFFVQRPANSPSPRRSKHALFGQNFSYLILLH